MGGMGEAFWGAALKTVALVAERRGLKCLSSRSSGRVEWERIISIGPRPKDLV